MDFGKKGKKESRGRGESGADDLATPPGGKDTG